MDDILERLLSELNEFREMLIFDRNLRGKYLMSKETKQYSIAIQEDIEEIIINGGGSIED